MTTNPGQPAAGAPAGAPPAAGTPPVAGVPAGAPSTAEHPATITAPWDSNEGVYTIGEGEQAKPWWSTIKEEPVRQLMETKQYKNPAEVAMAYHNLNKLQNGAADVVAMPGKDADPKQWDAFYAKMGRPATPDEYNLNVPEGAQVDQGLMKFGKELFHKMGASPEKAQAAFDEWQKFATAANAAQIEQARVQNDTELTALQAKWGEGLAEKQAAGNRAVKALGLDNALIERIEASIGSAAIVELLAAIGSKSPEGGFVGSGNSNDPDDPTAMTPEQATSRINALRSDPAFEKKYMDPKDPGHKDAVAKIERLFAKAK